MGQAKDRKRNGTYPKPLEVGGNIIGYGYKERPASIPVIRTDECPIRMNIATEAAYVLLSGFRQGYRPIKVAWLSKFSNEPIGLYVNGQDYTGILIRYEDGTRGWRCCAVPSCVREQIGGDVAFFGEAPFEKLEFYDSDQASLFNLVARLLEERSSDVPIVLPRAVR